jgi:hypothetical protein
MSLIRFIRSLDNVMTSVLTETELAVRTDNVPGAEGRVLAAILEWGLHVRALCSYTEGDRLMVRVVTDDAKQAKQALACAGYESKANPVVVVGLKNRVGAVAQLGAHLGKAGVDIVYSYASYMDDAEVVAVFKTHDDARAMEVLQSGLQSDQQGAVQSAAA